MRKFTSGIKHKQIVMQQQTNTNSSEKSNLIFAPPTVSIEIDSYSFLGDLLNEKEGLVKTKNMLTEVFTNFFVSDNFCGRQELNRVNYALLLENLQDWLDLCHAEFMAKMAEDEADKQIEALEVLRQNIANKKGGNK